MPTTTVTPPPIDDLTTLVPKKMVRARPLFDPQLMGRSLKASFVKLNPVTLFKNPVIFVVEVGATLTSVFLIRDMLHRGVRHRLFAANFSLALVHGALCQLCGGHGGSARQGTGRHPA